MEINTLSVLIATIPSRESSFKNLLEYLYIQCYDIKHLVEVKWDNSLDYNIGTKRNKLLQQASGKYIVFIDDDDHIAPNYVELILNACKDNTDCIAINGTITTNGYNERKWFISMVYKRWHELNGVYFRTPNHISPVRRELALQAGFPEIAFGEDAVYSERLYTLLKTETTILQPIYHYDFWHK